jgi:hypothetical protein
LITFSVWAKDRVKSVVSVLRCTEAQATTELMKDILVDSRGDAEAGKMIMQRKGQTADKII